MPLWIILLFLAVVFIVVMGFVISSQNRQIADLKKAKVAGSVPNVVFSQDASQRALEEWNSPPVKSTTTTLTTLRPSSRAVFAAKRKGHRPAVHTTRTAKYLASSANQCNT